MPRFGRDSPVLFALELDPARPRGGDAAVRSMIECEPSDRLEGPATGMYDEDIGEGYCV